MGKLKTHSPTYYIMDNWENNDNDNENKFIVMNYIGTMTAVKLNTESRHLDIAFEYWHSILKFMTKGAWSLGLQIPTSVYIIYFGVQVNG